MNKNWKRKTVTAMVAIALMMQQVGVSNVASAKENVNYIEQEEVGVLDRWSDIDRDEYDEWEDVDAFEYDEYDDEDEYDEYDDEDEYDEYDDEYGYDEYDDEYGYDEYDDEDEYDEYDDEDEYDEYDDEDEYDMDEYDEDNEPSMAVTSLTLKSGKTSEIAIDGDWEEVVWKSSKDSVAKVDSNGKVTGLKAGTATITAIVYYYDYIEDYDEWEDVDEEDEAEDYDIDDEELSIKILKCTVRVTAAPLKINAKKVTLKVGKSKNLKAIGAKGKVTWKTSNKKVAKVVNGKVTALKKGKAKITAKIGGKTLTCIVIVKKK